VEVTIAVLGSPRKTHRNFLQFSRKGLILYGLDLGLRVILKWILIEHDDSTKTCIVSLRLDISGEFL
jgi:hypothetical protein